MAQEFNTDRPYLRTISQSKQICDHPLNISPTKQQYSFPHEQRFRLGIVPFNCKAEFYTVNEKLFRTQRACSLGIGNRYDFSKNCRATPSPNTYFPKNYSIEASKLKGRTFGIARELSPQLGIVPYLKNSKSKPGPGAYTPILPKDGRVVTLHIKLTNQLHKINPVGPGQYNVPSTFQPSNLIINSQFRNAKNTKFAPLRDLADIQNKKNMTEEAKNGVEPSYLATDKTYQINKKGVFFNSKYKNSLCRYFGKESRENFKIKNNFPGPGTYRQMSAFGFYESSKAFKE